MIKDIQNAIPHHEYLFHDRKNRCYGSNGIHLKQVSQTTEVISYRGYYTIRLIS